MNTETGLRNKNNLQKSRYMECMIFSFKGIHFRYLLIFVIIPEK